MIRWLTILLLLVIPMSAPGCSGSKELGPMDESAVPEVDAAEVQRGMEESMKHMPEGARPPASAIPGASAPAESPAPAESSE